MPSSASACSHGSAGPAPSSRADNSKDACCSKTAPTNAAWLPRCRRACVRRQTTSARRAAAAPARPPRRQQHQRSDAVVTARRRRHRQTPGPGKPAEDRAGASRTCKRAVGTKSAGGPQVHGPGGGRIKARLPDIIDFAARERGPRMYEMQGPRLVDHRKLADCPSELVRRGNRRSARSGLPTTGPGHPQKFRLPGTLAFPELPLGGTRFQW